MSPQQADELMNKRGFSLSVHRSDGLRMYSYTDIERTPRLMVLVSPERNEFKIAYSSIYSVNKIETPWCSPLSEKEHFKKILVEARKWARKVEELYKEG